MDVTVIVENLPLYFQGLWVTIQLVVMSLGAGFADLNWWEALFFLLLGVGHFREMR